MANRNYRVTGEQPVVLDKRYVKGEEFSADLAPEHEAFLVQIGAIEVAERPPKKQKEEE